LRNNNETEVKLTKQGSKGGTDQGSKKVGSTVALALASS